MSWVSRNCLSNLVLRIQYMKKRLYVDICRCYESEEDYVATWRRIQDDVFNFFKAEFAWVQFSPSVFLVQQS
jgi:hypothetical protein